MKHLVIIATCVALLCSFFVGCDEEPESTTMNEVTNFDLIAGELSLQLMWTNPAASDFEGVEIFYRKDADTEFTPFAGTINPERTIIHSLESEILYHVKIKCLYSDPDRVTEGLVESETTFNDDLPPDVTNISFVEGFNSITVRWTNPDIPDFDRVEIEYGFLDDVYTSIEEPLDPSGTTVDGLLRDRTYYFKFKVFDIQANESKGISDSASTLPFRLRDEGPGGGLIFYVDLSAPFGFKYLQAAPLEWKGYSNPTSPWATATEAPGLTINYSEIFVNTTDTIFSGEENTMKMVEAHPNPPNFPFAANRCYSLIFNGFDDWFLPSIEQLKGMYDNLHNVSPSLGDFDETTTSKYWSSVQVSDRDTYAKTLDFDNKAVAETHKSNAHTVRPIRAFSFVDTVTTPIITTDPSEPYLPGTPYTVTINCSTDGAAMYYTVDNSDVDEDSNPYSAPFIFTTSAETGPPIKAKAFKDYYDSSSVAIKKIPISGEDD